MKALLLAGGLGTRLRPLTEDLPKPMVPVGNRPWLEHLILHLKDQGIHQFVITAKHYAEVIQQYFGDGRQLGVEIEHVVEPTLLGTAGAIKNAEHLLGDRFIVFNADIVHHVDLLPLLEFHRSHQGAVTIGLVEVANPSQYGVVEQDSTGAILRFVEKPKPEEAPSNRVNAGIYVMEKTALRWIPRGREVSIERETFPMLIEQGAGVYGKTISGYWMDLGTKERYRQAHWDLLNQELRLKLDAEEREPGIWIGRNVRLGNGVLLLPPVLAGDDVTIGDGAVVGPYSVIGKGCKIGKGANILHSILWSDCRLPDGVRVEDSIVGQGVELEPNGKYVDEVLNRTAEVVGQ